MPISLSYTESQIIFVNDDNINGPWDGSFNYPFQFINEGIKNSNNGSIIFVFNGYYPENIIINKAISIIGENKNYTIIDGLNNANVLNVVDNNTSIKNFTIKNSGGYKNNAGIYINSIYNNVENCLIFNTKSGIILNNSSNNNIKNSIFHTNGEGIFINSSNYNFISECYFKYNSLGINIEKSENIIINNSYATINGIGFFINDSSNIDINKCALFNNNDNQGGIFLNICNNISIYNSIIRHNGFGINIKSCYDINISKTNLFFNTHTGLYIEKNSNNIIVYRSNIYQNFRFGIYVENSICKLINNNFFDSLLGVYLEKSNCDLRYNWWNSFIGPSFFEIGENDRLFFKNSIVKIFPWQYKKIINAGSNWNINFNLCEFEINNTFIDNIILSGIDIDNDKIPNIWEEKWGYDPFVWDDHENLDPDNDALNNIQECYTDKWGSNPFYKDIFLEYDWVESENSNFSNKPSNEFISKMISEFEKNEINLHVDIGNLDGGEKIPKITNFSFSDLRDLYWDYFLHNDLNNPRKNIFHYCIVCDYGPSSGFAFFGWNSLDSFLISAQTLKNNQPKFYSRDRLIVGGSIHELGHTLGLFVDDHGGNDNTIATWPLTLQWWKYLNYRSCMNYWYTYKIIGFSDGRNGKNDFNDWENMDFYFFKNSNFNWPKDF